MDHTIQLNSRPSLGPAPMLRNDLDRVTDIAPPGWPFRVLKRPGKRHYRVRFLVGHLAYEGSTGCHEADLALTVAKVLFVETLDALSQGGDGRPAAPGRAFPPRATAAGNLSPPDRGGAPQCQTHPTYLAG